MYANAAKNPEPRASSAFGSTVPTSGEIIRTIPANAVNTRLATDAETLSASILPERRATNRGPVYWRVTACPIGILPSAVKYRIMANSPTTHLSNMVL